MAIFYFQNDKLIKDHCPVSDTLKTRPYKALLRRHIHFCSKGSLQ